MDSTCFEFATAGKIIFGPGTISSLPKLIPPTLRRCLILTGAQNNRWQTIIQTIQSCTEHQVIQSIVTEPTIDNVANLLEVAREADIDGIISIGGGSVIDTGKAIAGMLNEDQPVTNYLEVIGAGQALTAPVLPHIAIPTTAGTGAEVTRNAVLCAPDPGVKVSLRSPNLYPTVALVDPTLTISMPASVTASSGMDALVQLIEAFLTCCRTPLTTALCKEALPRAWHSLPIAYTEGTNLEARTDMALASLFSGIALANSRLGIIHGIAGVVGGRYGVKHGEICATLLSSALKVNYRLAKQFGNDEVTRRFESLSELLGFSNSVDKLISKMSEQTTMLGIPQLNQFKLPSDEFGTIAEKANKAGSTKGNPLPLKQENIVEILEGAW